MWSKIPLRETELSLSKVLRCGQTFRWKNIHNVWSFSLQDRIILLKQDQEALYYSSIPGKHHPGAANTPETLKFINDYFTLHINLEELYASWKQSHSKFQRPRQRQEDASSPFERFTGIRILRQDPWECLVSFICSSNNNVKRISKMCENLCVNFGEYVNEHEGHAYYAFPTPQQLSGDEVEAKLRELGFGYRAKYIHQTAKKFTSSAFVDITRDKLDSLRDASYEEAHEFLLQLTGVGPKVADCICLMSLDKHEVVPIDTHVYQIAVRDYKYRGKRDVKTLNKEMHLSIRGFFRDIFGEYAGWAQSVLFAADLSDLNNGTNVVEVEAEKTTPVVKREIAGDVAEAVKKIKVTSAIKVEN
ncbi:uncharacterized protein LODBEIA_P59770 [Lodderomyces beijingensis]|uniref:DNA-(apurinic or apyrimidinic site) lyase n=1 Tax=Lodderomyces beijingensis TaxID=1775926 RepID=A0ABP0ZUE0_9ASCO